MLTFSIIIPTLNEKDYLPRLLQSIVEQDYDGLYEVVIVDGGSDDNSLALAKGFEDKIPGLILLKSQRGIAHQRNAGAKKAQCNNLVFLDADTQLSKGTLARFSAHFATHKNFVAIPLLLPYDGKFMDFIFTVVAYSYFLLMKAKRPVISGMCIITTRENHERIGGFNERAMYAEDIDYGLRSVRSGARYHIFFRTLIRASTRRLDKVGRLKLGLMWLEWHREVSRKGAITKRRHEYEFGEFKSKRH